MNYEHNKLRRWINDKVTALIQVNRIGSPILMVKTEGGMKICPEFLVTSM